MTSVVGTTDLPLERVRRGKVRDVYAVDAERLLGRGRGKQVERPALKACHLLHRHASAWPHPPPAQPSVADPG